MEGKIYKNFITRHSECAPLFQQPLDYSGLQSQRVVLQTKMNSQIQRLLQGMGGAATGGAPTTLPDTSEQVFISPLALLKMLRHGRAGIPMEVVGLLLGEFIDDYTIKVVDTFSMPQRGNTVSIEDIDPVYQTTMLEYLKQTGRPEAVVGWYHSHPGFGCWFSGTDMNTQQSFEQLNPRAVGVVVDPIQSVKGKVVMDCFRLVSPTVAMSGSEPRQTTTNVGSTSGVKPSITALVHGLGRHYYSINVTNKNKNNIEQMVLSSLDKGKWQRSLKLADSFSKRNCENKTLIKDLVKLTAIYKHQIVEEMEVSEAERIVRSAGRVNAKLTLADLADRVLADNAHKMLAVAVAQLAVA